MLCENTPTLETRRLILRKFADRDIDDMLSLYSDTEVNRFLPWLPIETKAAMTRYLHDCIVPFYEKSVAYSYAIALKPSGRVIGYVHINDVGESNGMGYALHKAFWNQGIITEACAAIIDHLRKVRFPYITAKHNVNNPASGAVMKKLGMTYRYSYKELWQPKNILVTFRVYQLDLDGAEHPPISCPQECPVFIEQF